MRTVMGKVLPEDTHRVDFDIIVDDPGDVGGEEFVEVNVIAQFDEGEQIIGAFEKDDDGKIFLRLFSFGDSRGFFARDAKDRIEVKYA